MTTLEEILRRAAEQPDDNVRATLLLLPFRRISYDQFTDLVETSLVYASKAITRNPGLYMDMSEDQLTQTICSNLDAMGFDASFNSMVGGHCDVTVEAAGGYMWLAEAKIHTDYAWLAKGYNQLTTRYATGQPNQSSGGLIIYIKQPRIDNVMKEWRDTLTPLVTDITLSECNLMAAAFYSVALNERTGVPFKAIHFPLSVYFAPDDDRKPIVTRKRTP